MFTAALFITARKKNENVVHMHYGILFSGQEKQNHKLCRPMDGIRKDKLSEVIQTQKTDVTFPYWKFLAPHFKI